MGIAIEFNEYVLAFLSLDLVFQVSDHPSLIHCCLELQIATLGSLV